MAAAELAARAVDAVFGLRGDSAVISTASGDVTALAIRRAPSDRVEFGGGPPATVETVTLLFRAVDVVPTGAGLGGSYVTPGTHIAVAGETRVVQGEPEWGDPLRQTVVVDTRPA